jgi:hypothetical protein
LIETGFLRLLIFDLSEFRSSGMWKNFGGSQSNARYSSTCLGVDEIHSSARITCEISIR